MIVLENVSVALTRKIDQCGPAGETHRHAERKLVGRCYINDFGRRLLRRPGDYDSFPVNRPRNYGRPGETKNSASLVKSRVFYPCDLTPVYQGHRTDHHGLLCPGCDDDLIGMTARTPIIA